MYQFARDAAVAEAWLIAQEPYLMSSELGHTIDEVENLIKKHEAFEKSAAAQEERFIALRRLTTVSGKLNFFIIFISIPFILINLRVILNISSLYNQFELKEIKRRQDAAEEAERKRLQQEQEERAAAEAQIEAARKAESKDSHDAPGSPAREAGKCFVKLFIIPITIFLFAPKKKLSSSSLSV